MNILILLLVVAMSANFVTLNGSYGSYLTRRASKISLTPELQNVEVEKFSGVNKDVSEEATSHFACQLVRIIQILQHPDCIPKAIDSFACSGTCPSYVQVSSFRN